MWVLDPETGTYAPTPYESNKVPLSEQVNLLKEEKKTLQLAVVDLFEQTLSLEDKNKSTMLAITELYELILTPEGGE